MIIYYGEQTEDILNEAVCKCFGTGREISRGEHGKPYFSDGNGFLSITHTDVDGLRIWIAVFSDVECGIDAEAFGRRVGNVLGIAGRYFTESETAYLTGLAERDRSRAFIRLWTMKEALLKMKGTGIAGGLDSAELVSDGMPVEDCAGARFINIDMEEFPGLCVTLAVDEKAADGVLPEEIRIVRLGEPGQQG